jgi:hypothetical protein
VLGSSYTYTVVAANGAVTSPVSTGASIVFAAPAAPTAITAVSTNVLGSTTRANVLLNWAAAAPGVTYTVQRVQPAVLGGGTTTLLTNSTVTTFTDLNVRRNAPAPYTYQIRANAGPLSSAYVTTLVVVN